MESNYILSMKNITKIFPGVKALDRVNLNVRAGTVHALMGENGAGKSTLMKILDGLIQPDAGEIWINGKLTEALTPKKAAALGVAMIHQELSSAPNLTIAENIFLGREPMRGCAIDQKAMLRDAEIYMKRMRIRYPPTTKAGDVSVSIMQLVEICKAISCNAKIIVMDEPTSAITDAEVDTLFECIKELKQAGVAIIYITHKLDELFRIADDVTVLRDGQWIGTAPAKELDKDRVISMMIGRELSNVFPKEFATISSEALRVENLSRKGIFRDISFSVRHGEILGIAGLIGSGRTETMQCIFGLDRPDAGSIYLDGKPVTIRCPSDALKHGIAMVPEDRKVSGLVLGMSIKENITLAFLSEFMSGIAINSRKEKACAQSIIDMLHIKTKDQRNHADSLSGGNQQKIVLGKWLVSDVEVLIMDEPTRGVDVGAKAEIHKIMCQLAQKGLAIIMISSELPEVLGMSDRILVMHEGRLKGELQRDEADQEKIMKIALSA